MSTGLSPSMNNLDLNMDIINEEFWNQVFDLHRLLTAIPKDTSDYWRDIIKTFHSKYTKTDA